MTTRMENASEQQDGDVVGLTKRMHFVERQKAELQQRCSELSKQLQNAQAALAKERERAAEACLRVFAESKKQVELQRELRLEVANLREELSFMKRNCCPKYESEDAAQHEIERLTQEIISRGKQASKALLTLETEKNLEMTHFGMVIFKLLLQHVDVSQIPLESLGEIAKLGNWTTEQKRVFDLPS